MSNLCRGGGYAEVDEHETIVNNARVHYSTGINIPIGFTAKDFKKIRVDFYDMKSSTSYTDAHRFNTTVRNQLGVRPRSDIDFVFTGNLYQPEIAVGKASVAMWLDEVTNEVKFKFRYRGPSFAFVYLSLRIYEIE